MSYKTRKNKYVNTIFQILFVITLFLFLTAGQPVPLKSTPGPVAQPDPSGIDSRWTEVTATAYCPCAICCGFQSANGITASGQVAQSSRTLAADLSIYPIGTRLYIKDLGIRVVEDTGGALHNQSIDLYFDTHEEALQFGRQTLYVKEIL